MVDCKVSYVAAFLVEQIMRVSNETEVKLHFDRL